MVYRYLFPVISLLYSFLPFWLSAQPGEIVTRHFSMKDGLAHNQLFSLLQDSQGFIWVGSYAGLSRFDGYRFTTYQNNPADTNSLSDNIITYLWEDRQQRIWVGLFTGLNVFDPKTEKFYRLKFDLSGSAIDDGVQISKIQERSDGKVWLCTAQGLYLANPETLTVQKFTYHSADKSKSLSDSVLNGRFSDIIETTDGSFWLASKEGLLHWDAIGSQLTHFRHDPNDPHSISSNKVMTVHLNHSGQLLVGSYGGLDIFNPLDSTFTPIITDRLHSDNAFWQKHPLLEKTDGSLWIGFGDGLYSFSTKTKQLDQVLSQDIRSIIEDSQGNTWVATPKGLYQILPDKRKFTINREIVQTKNSLMESVLDLVNTQYYSGPDIWGIIPTTAGGWRASNLMLEKYDSRNQTFSSIPLPFSPLALYRDSHGKIWLGSTVEFGIFDPQTEVYERLTDFTNIKVNDFLEDRFRNMWVATSKGLIRYDRNTETVEVFKHDPADPQSLSDNRIRDLLMDQSGGIWIGTLRGLNKMVAGTERNNPKFDNWRSTNSNLPHDYITGIVEDDDTTLWIGCGSQITHFFPKTGEFRNYNYQDGLSGQNIGKGLKSQQGEIYFLNGKIEDGLIVFHPDSLQDNFYIPPVKITNFTIDNELVPLLGSFNDTLSWETPLIQSITYTDAVELNHQQNDFSLEFTALNLVSPENNQYKYRLEPYEIEWVEASANNRVARYTNISPGEYTFRVIGSNNDGLWNEKGASLQLTILPPWWQTGWAYVLYGLLALSAILTLRHYEMKRFKLRQRAEHLAELDALKTRFFTNISHEFRTPLTLILGPLKAMQEGTFSGDQKSVFQMMIRNGQRLLNLINQLLDLSKMEAGKLELRLVSTDLVTLLRQIASAYESMASDRNINFFFYPEVQQLIAYVDIEKTEKIMHNLLSNAFKFTAKGGKIMLSLQKTSSLEAVIALTDTGPGIPADELDKVFDRFYQIDGTHTRTYEGSGLGMSLTKELVEMHQGRIAVESKVGTGTTFTVWLPLGKDHLTDQQIFELTANRDNQRADGYSLMEEVSPTDNLSEASDSISEAPLVLIVEDNADMREYIRQILSGSYQIREASGGKEGINLARELLPDLIISDIMMPSLDMPKIDGYQLCQQLKTNTLTSHIPIILLTAKADQLSKLAGLELGADDYLAKPFDRQELHLIVRNHIAERQKLREQFGRQISLEPSSVPVSSVDDQFLRLVKQVVEDHLADPSFSVEALGQEMGMSRMQLFRKLKALTDYSPVEFIRAIRLKRAAQLLTQGAGTIADIAYQVGFQDPSYFTKCFHKQYGQTPSEFISSTIS